MTGGEKVAARRGVLRRWAVGGLAGTVVLLTVAVSLMTNVVSALVPHNWTWASNLAVTGSALAVLVVLLVTLAIAQHRLAPGTDAGHWPVGPSLLPGGLPVPTVVRQPATGPSDQAADKLPFQNLPFRNPDFTGRVDLLQALSDTLGQGPTVLVAVHGLGGIGKTQLALEFAHRGLAGDRYTLVWWVRAESALTLGEDLASLAPVLDVPVSADQGRTVAEVRAALARRQRWLLVFDNAPDAGAVRQWLPTGPGHVLVTSRDPGWRGLAHRVDVSAFHRGESVTYLLRRAGGGQEQAARALAEEVGDLPLALAQAVAYMESNGGLSVAEYLRLYRDESHTGRLLAGGIGEYPHSVATTWLIHYRDLARRHPAALQLLRLCAHLDPDDIDVGLVLSRPRLLAGGLTGALAAAAVSAETLQRVVGTLARTGLVVRLDGAYRIRMHRLVVQVTRHHIRASRRRPWRGGGDVAARWAQHTVVVLNGLFPQAPEDPTSWATCSALAAHSRVAVGLSAGFGSPDAPTGDLHYRLGRYLYVRVDLAAAAAGLRDACDIYQRVLGPDDSRVADALVALGRVQRRQDQLDTARATLERACDIYQRVLGPDDSRVADALVALGRVQRRQDQLDTARASLERACDIYQRVFGPDDSRVAYALVALGQVQRRQDQLDTARASLERACDIYQRVFGPDDCAVAYALVALGQVQRRQDQLDTARASLERACDIYQRVFGPDDSRVAYALVALGDVQRRQDQLDTARASLERACDIYQRVFGPDDSRVAYALVVLGDVQRRQDQLDTARASVERARDIFQRVFGPDDSRVAYALVVLGQVQRRQDQLDTARASLERACDIYQRVCGPGHSWTVSAKALLDTLEG